MADTVLQIRVSLSPHLAAVELAANKPGDYSELIADVQRRRAELLDAAFREARDRFMLQSEAYRAFGAMQTRLDALQSALGAAEHRRSEATADYNEALADPATDALHLARHQRELDTAEADVTAARRGKADLEPRLESAKQAAEAQLLAALWNAADALTADARQRHAARRQEIGEILFAADLLAELLVGEQLTQTFNGANRLKPPMEARAYLNIAPPVAVAVAVSPSRVSATR